MRQITNDPKRAGELAGKKRIFGKASRYAIAPIHSRFDTVGWFVWDAEKPDFQAGRDPVMGYSPAVIRVCNSRTEALAGLI